MTGNVIDIVTQRGHMIHQLSGMALACREDGDSNLYQLLSSYIESTVNMQKDMEMQTCLSSGPSTEKH